MSVTKTIFKINAQNIKLIVFATHGNTSEGKNVCKLEILKNVLGVRFYNKHACDSGLELADLYSYLSMQKLRFKDGLTEEFKGLDTDNLNVIKKSINYFEIKQTDLIDITKYDFINKKTN